MAALPDLVGICGEKFAGKSTLARAFVDAGYAECPLAAPLRDVAQRLFLLSDEECEDPARKEKPGVLGVSYRRAMQVLGTDVVRGQFGKLFPELACDSNAFWIEHARMQVAAHRRKGVKVVVSDVRFVDEAQFVLNNGGVLLFVKRRDRESVAAEGGWAASAATAAHASERQVADVEATFCAPPTAHARAGVVTNNSTVSALRASGLALAAQLHRAPSG